MFLSFPVTIEGAKPEYHITVGKKDVVPVTVNGYPRPIVNWKKLMNGSFSLLVELDSYTLSGPEANTSPTNGRMSINPNTGHLIIENVRESDTGTYQVEGTDDSNITISKNMRIIATGLLSSVDCFVTFLPSTLCKL